MQVHGSWLLTKHGVQRSLRLLTIQEPQLPIQAVQGGRTRAAAARRSAPGDRAGGNRADSCSAADSDVVSQGCTIGMSRVPLSCRHAVRGQCDRRGAGQHLRRTGASRGCRAQARAGESAAADTDKAAGPLGLRHGVQGDCARNMAIAYRSVPAPPLANSPLPNAALASRFILVLVTFYAEPLGNHACWVGTTNVDDGHAQQSLNGGAVNRRSAWPVARRRSCSLRSVSHAWSFQPCPPGALITAATAHGFPRATAQQPPRRRSGP